MGEGWAGEGGRVLQALAQLKTKVRDVPGATRNRARSGWSARFFAFLKKHFIKTAANKVRKAETATKTPKAAAFDILKGLDQQLQACLRFFMALRAWRYVIPA